MNSRPIIQRTVVRQTAEPNRPLAGMTWINPAGGQSGNNSETYVWNDDAGSWELTRSTGPDTPLNAAAGATWTDTGNGTVKNYRAGAWQNVGVTDHANLSNVTASQHHTRYTDSEAIANFGAEQGTVTFSSGGTTQVNFASTYAAGKTLATCDDQPLLASSSDNFYGAWVDSWVTDANGDYTGMVIGVEEAGDVDAHWSVFGVTV